MRRLKTKPFPYYVGLHSLEELVTREHRVCVMNILGSESRKVTPVSHEYSGGNIVAGVQYGRRGSLDTKIGSIPVYRSIREVMEKGIAFDMGVVYIPPQGVCKAVSELVTHNEALKRIVIVTEKVCVVTLATSGPYARKPAWTSSAPTAWAWPTPGIGSASAAAWVAITPTRRW